MSPHLVACPRAAAGEPAVKAAERPDPHVVVVFGATGDLAKRKLLPGLFHLARAGLLPERYRIIGSAPAKSSLPAAAGRGA